MDLAPTARGVSTMSMVCPQCKKAYKQALQCPSCRVRLSYHDAPTAHVENGPEPERSSQWSQTPWGRMVVGLILAQGLSYGLQQLLTAWWLASGEEGILVWTTLWGLVLLHSLQGVSLLLGGALTGAGQVRGILYGAYVGLVNGLIFLAVQRQGGEFLTDLVLFGQPFLHLVFGALGGFIGQVIWKPVPRIQTPEPMAFSPASRSRRGLGGPRWLAGPVHLSRVLVGAASVVLGVVSSNKILEFVVTTSEGKLSLTSHLQAQLVAWEIAALVIVFGAGVAGATTSNGLKQGLCVGVGASLVFVGIQLGHPKATMESMLFMLISMIGFGMIGGWFGAALFPPVVAQRKRNRILTG